MFLSKKRKQAFKLMHYILTALLVKLHKKETKNVFVTAFLHLCYFKCKEIALLVCFRKGKPHFYYCIFV